MEKKFLVSLRKFPAEVPKSKNSEWKCFNYSISALPEISYLENLMPETFKNLAKYLRLSYTLKNKVKIPDIRKVYIIAYLVFYLEY